MRYMEAWRLRATLIAVLSSAATLCGSCDLAPDNMFGPEISVHPTSITIAEGHCGYVDIDMNPGFTDSWYYHASTSNPRVARLGCPEGHWLNDTLPGNVCGIAPGRATITYQVIWDDGTEASADLSVRVTAASAHSLTLALDTATIKVGQNLWIEPFPKDATGWPLFAHDITWVSSDTTAATVMRADWGEDDPVGVGRVYGEHPGQTTVTATVAGVSASANITVIPADGTG